MLLTDAYSNGDAEHISVEPTSTELVVRALDEAIALGWAMLDSKQQGGSNDTQ